ncbi:unnamed protein product, partial [Angiostrongylus costaricensis]|uniref:Ufm1-specific protease 2 n=1 Tax=Angiostrongylus costaricensis TaxID=334426 RepID=A0A158PEE9_ANGCS
TATDVELVGNVCVEGEHAPLIGNGFTITTTRDVLENADSTTFLTQNNFLRHGNVIPDGLSVRIQVLYHGFSKIKVEFSSALRSGSEITDLRTAAEKFTASLDQLTFARADKRILLRKNMDKATWDNERPLDKISFGALQYKVNTVTIPDAASYLRILTTLDVTVPAVFEDSSQVLYDRLVEGIRRKVSAMVYMMIHGFRNQQKMVPTVSQVFLPPGWSSLLHLQMLMSDEIEQHSARVRLHKLFNLPLSMPCIRSSQAITFAPTRLLRSPHIHINNCEFHHFLRVMLNDGVNDSGWGCAYRSLQSIWSWFILNGFTDKPVPTHLGIQQCLVDIKDKEENFLGSRQWIGSTEIGFVLDHLLGIQSRYIITSSGAEVIEKAHELALHFETVGTPVMIGGAQLAHTILGVDFNEGSGECNFLVLDPHYTGSEDMKVVLGKGWCAWKPASFWNPQYFYNMVLPQTPKNVV